MTMIPAGLMRRNGALDFGCCVSSKYQEILHLHELLNACRIPCEMRQIFDGWELCYPSIEDCLISASQIYPIYQKHGDLIELLDHRNHTRILDAVTIAEIITNYHQIDRLYDRRSVYVES